MLCSIESIVATVKTVSSVKSEKLVKDIVPYISVPTTYSALADAQAIDVKLRDALIACGIMLADI